MKVDLETGINRTALRQFYWEPAIVRVTPSFDDDTQEAVYEKLALTDDDVSRISDEIFEEARETYRQALDVELNRWGCVSEKAVLPEDSDEVLSIRLRADWAAQSIVTTYNTELAKEIVRFGEGKEGLPQSAYMMHLKGWDSLYWQTKVFDVALMETLTVDSAALVDFYRHNDDLEPRVVVLPLEAVCELCQELIDGNPYLSVFSVFRVSPIPAHVRCVHWMEPAPDRALDVDECSLLWVGL